ncbi:MAG: NADH-quinone oxidoreductase subunit L, partial [Actinomycetota bacterium]
LDERVLDRGVTAVSAGALRLARAAGRTDAAGVDGAVRGTADALLRAGSLARRPQTGLVHQYYAMAAAGLGVLLVLLLIGR